MCWSVLSLIGHEHPNYSHAGLDLCRIKSKLHHSMLVLYVSDKSKFTNILPFKCQVIIIKRENTS